MNGAMMSRNDGIGVLSEIASVILVAAGTLSLSGCDPVRTTRQSITIEVKDSRGMPVRDAKIRIKESWESWKSWTPEGVKGGDSSFYRDRWESEFVPWIEGLTNDQGKAVLNFDVTALDATKGREPPRKRDWVSNSEYIVRIYNSKDAVDELLVVMKPGTISRGKRYTVRIESIGKPRYVQADVPGKNAVK